MVAGSPSREYRSRWCKAHLAPVALAPSKILTTGTRFWPRTARYGRRLAGRPPAVSALRR